MVDFAELSTELENLGLKHHASELHGLVSGYVCSGLENDGAGYLMDWLGEAPEAGIHDLLDRLIVDTGSVLADPEIGFQPLVPDEEHPLGQRGKAISRWCMGFMSGFGATVDFNEKTLDDEVKEVLADLDRISRMTEDIPDSEENEADFTEIIEYVRVSTLLVFASYGLSARSGDN